MSRTEKLLAIIAAAAVGVSLYAGALRWRVEMPNRSVAVIVDWQECEVLAALGGLAMEELLPRLRAAGVTHVAVAEQRLSGLVAQGQVTVLSPRAAGLEDAAEGVVLSAYDEATAARLRAQLAAKLPSEAIVHHPDLSPLLIHCRAPVTYLERVGLGWPPEYPETVEQAGLRLVARLDNYPGVSSGAITSMLTHAFISGAELIIFAADQVLGYPHLIGDTALTLEAAGIDYGSVELASQLGDQTLSRELEGAVVRVHSITEGEMVTMSPPRAAARYARAVRERGIRACYVRMFLASSRPIGFNDQYLKAIRQELGAAGYDTGRPRPLGPVGVPAWAVMLMALGAVAAAVLALGRLAPLPGWLSGVLFLAGAAMAAGLMVAAPHLMRAEKALLAALAFPSMAMIAVAAGARTQRAAADASARAVAARGAGYLIAASAVSLAGGLLAAGLLSERLFMSKAMQFTGVKLALLTPLLTVGLVWTLGLYRGAAGEVYRRRVQENFRQVWNRPVYVWEAVLAGVVLAAAAVMLLRSGNQPPVEVTGLELRVRGVLEQVFMARPRTKEFLLGHPALMLAVAMALRGRVRWVLLFLVLGAVGQASLVNTFAHLHTPLLISLVRTAHGLWLGLVIGSAVVLIWDRLRARVAQPSQQQQTSGS